MVAYKKVVFYFDTYNFSNDININSIDSLIEKWKNSLASTEIHILTISANNSTLHLSMKDVIAIDVIE